MHLVFSVHVTMHRIPAPIAACEQAVQAQRWSTGDPYVLYAAYNLHFSVCHNCQRACLRADGAVLDDDALLCADAEPLGCDAVDYRVRLLLRHVVARQEDVQCLLAVQQDRAEQQHGDQVRVTATLQLSA